MEKKLTAQIAAMYLGCNVSYTDINGRPTIAKLTGVSYEDIQTTYSRRRNNCKGDYLSFKPNAKHNVDALHAKLILKPLSEISDEDAIDAAKIIQFEAGYIGNKPAPEYMLKPAIAEELQNIFSDKNTEEMECMSGQQFVTLINFLRSKSYDCDNLISQNIAITKIK